uniref:Uncharacterized protein n=1 Tax=Phaeomonas parva TaxID=124430 RepID=A0A7S1UF11_9STRA|mmetsp:Transcript_45142/g.141437  ORF Transcript_45142/g.141437 Transcript_45142/m.141437 type:complete len:390 (+) Transcript_45142:166-1335(+)
MGNVLEGYDEGVPLEELPELVKDSSNHLFVGARRDVEAMDPNNPAHQEKAKIRLKRFFDKVRKNVEEAQALAQTEAKDRQIAEEFMEELAQGLTLMKLPVTGRGPAKQRLLWLVPYTNRLHVARSKSTVSSKGLYLIDIGKVWRGKRTPPFTENPIAENFADDCCVSILGSERTIDVVLPNADEATSFADKFEALLRTLRLTNIRNGTAQYGQAIAVPGRNKMMGIVTAAQVRRLLVKGMNFSRVVGKRLDSVKLWLGEDRKLHVGRSGHLEGADRYFEPLAVNHIIEFRAGMYTKSFQAYAKEEEKKHAASATEGSSADERAFSIMACGRNLDLLTTDIQMREFLVTSMNTWLEMLNNATNLGSSDERMQDILLSTTETYSGYEEPTV